MEKIDCTGGNCGFLFSPSMKANVSWNIGKQGLTKQVRLPKGGLGGMKSTVIGLMEAKMHRETDCSRVPHEKTARGFCWYPNYGSCGERSSGTLEVYLLYPFDKRLSGLCMSPVSSKGHSR